ncbi:MAG TPA: hypothetical protein VK698_29575 [Kofleriaceae bacterium]|nr:hypothetical protein [Kofleriaceae bacterium]
MRRTTRNRSLAIPLCAALAACGGDDDGGSDEGATGTENAAIDRSFDYGTPTNASAAQAMVLQSGLSNVVSLSDAPSVSAAIALASITTVTATLLGPTIGLAAGLAARRDRPAAAAAAAAARTSLDDDCTVVTDTTITFDHCELTLGGTSTITDGAFYFSDGGRMLTWDLSVTSVIEIEGLSSEAGYHQAGSITIGEGTIRGELLSEYSASATSAGTTFAYEMSEALILDLAYLTAPPCVTGGTLEARRVWTRRPDGFPTSSWPDGGVLIVWSGCNQATVATSI